MGARDVQSLMFSEQTSWRVLNELGQIFKLFPKHFPSGILCFLHNPMVCSEPWHRARLRDVTELLRTGVQLHSTAASVCQGLGLTLRDILVFWVH